MTDNNINSLKCPKCGYEDNPSSARKCEICGQQLQKSKLGFLQLQELKPNLLLIGGVIALLPFFLYYFWNHRACEVSTEVRAQGTCYKDLTRNPLIIGILTSPEEYSQLELYLEQELSSQVSDVVIEGNFEITYQEVQDKIAQEKWDIVFARSPMNGMRAKDNNYQWVARMFPDLPSTYQSALFVRSDSSIQSIDDLKTDTTVALGDFSSASSFYVPAYDLYGKSMTVISGNRGSEIVELVSTGNADVGAAVYGAIADDPRFRIIHVSREIPGTGVYLSPNLLPAIQQQISQALIDAPQDIKDEANYGPGDEPNYETLRLISIRADEVLSCADFSNNPVQFFCASTSEGILGKISGFTNEGDGAIRLRLEQESGGVCQIHTSLQVLSQVPGGTSPGVLNRKKVSIIGVEPVQLEDGTCKISVTDPTQLTVIESGN